MIYEYKSNLTEYHDRAIEAAVKWPRVSDEQRQVLQEFGVVEAWLTCENGERVTTWDLSETGQAFVAMAKEIRLARLFGEWQSARADCEYWYHKERESRLEGYSAKPIEERALHDEAHAKMHLAKEAFVVLGGKLKTSKESGGDETP